MLKILKDEYIVELKRTHWSFGGLVLKNKIEKYHILQYFSQACIQIMLSVYIKDSRKYCIENMATSCTVFQIGSQGLEI